MKKRLVIISILMVALVSSLLVGCGNKEDAEAEKEPSATVEENTEEPRKEDAGKEPAQTNQNGPSVVEPEDTPEVGGWTIVNQKFEEAPKEVQEVYSKAVSYVETKLIPVTYIGSQIVNGTNYGFVAKDSESNDRYLYIYQLLDGTIDKIEISKIGETLEILPSKEEIQAAVDSGLAEVNASKQGSQNQSSQPTDNSQNTEEAQPKNIEEALIKVYGSIDKVKATYNTDSSMNLDIKENTFTYSYTYPEELSEEELKVFKEEILNTYKESASTYTGIVKDIEKEAEMTGLTYNVRYLNKNGSEIVVVKFNNQGMVG